MIFYLSQNVQFNRNFEIGLSLQRQFSNTHIHPHTQIVDLPQKKLNFFCLIFNMILKIFENEFIAVKTLNVKVYTYDKGMLR